jgi:hypothetical protein
LSIAIQYRADLEVIRAALTKDEGGGPATLIGSALDALALTGGGSYSVAIS